MKQVCLFLAVACASPLFGATTHSVSCDIRTGTTILYSGSSEAECAVTGQYETYIQANASANLSTFGNSIIVSGSSAASTGTSVDFDSDGDGVGDTLLYASASAIASDNLTVLTAGELRTGILRWQTSSTMGGSSNGYGGTFVDASYISFTCNSFLVNQAISPCGGPTVPPFGPGSSGSIQVPLGIEFAVFVSTDAYASSYQGVGGSGGSDLSLILQFFEADGVTPVSVEGAGGDTTVPEPSTWVAGLGLFGMAVTRRSVANMQMTKGTSPVQR